MDDLFKKCMFDFSFFATNYIKVVHPIKGLTDFEAYDYHDKLLHAYSKNKNTIVKQPRQVGMTTFTLAWIVWKCLFQFDQKIIWLTKTERDARCASHIVKKFISNLPEWLMPVLQKDNDHQKIFMDTHSQIDFLTPTSLCSKSCNQLIVENVAFIPDMDNCWKAIRPTLTEGQCIVFSTPNGRGNWFEKTYYDALEHKNEFNIVDINYLEHPEYRNEEWAKQMKHNLGIRGWTYEVLASFD